MKLLTESYQAQQAHLPAVGKHIVAQHDDSHVWVYYGYSGTLTTIPTE